MESYEHKLKQGERGALLSIGAYVILSLVKIGTGYFTRSEALTADGINNTTDIAVSMAVLIGLRMARKPPDSDHPYGHMRAETIASMVASFVMAVAGLQVVLQAARSFWDRSDGIPDLSAAWVALGSAVVMGFVYWYNRRLAKRVGSQSLMAAAYDNRSDALVSLGAAAGILCSRLGLPILDPAAALAVGIVICKTAWDIFSEATHALTDGFDDAKLKVFRQTVTDTPGVKRIRDIRGRVHGSSVLLDVVVEVNAELSVGQSHGISDDIEKRMLDEHRIEKVHVHIEPYLEQER
ncbi:cation diffusion facilitator family transporter [Paenibacillus filicis]|uniref:Cation diffusion facilitator family transporter n=1 Tax=Paenibacillus gyeongsangnamensis TaxID=3388067 RepID=A0ABT4QB42_9BACL|nr:cation diffusion facilitator family transporter [Paenibacillus filicis]MCZ8514114.1 cation diffusion facilitator family transporter [Paenibacillus filicis]